MTLSPSPNRSVLQVRLLTEEWQPRREEMKGKGRGGGYQPFLSALLRERTGMVLLTGPSLSGGKRGLSSALSNVQSPLTCVCLCDAGPGRQREYFLKKRIWKTVLMRLKMKAFVSTFTWNFFIVADNCRRISLVQIK